MAKAKGLKEGEVYVLKTTGEKVFLLSYTGNQNEVNCRRPSVGLNEQTITHLSESFDASELETVQEHANRQITEGLVRLAAQKQMALAEQNTIEDAKIESVSGEQAKPAMVIMPSKKSVN